MHINCSPLYFIDKLLPGSFQTTAKISRVGHAHPDFFQGGRLPTLLPPCRRPWWRGHLCEDLDSGLNLGCFPRLFPNYNQKRTGGFWPVCSYILTSGFDNMRSSGTQIPPSQIADTETWMTAGSSISDSGRASVSGRISTSGIAAELRPWGPWKVPLSQSGNRKLTRSQIDVHKISLATTNVSCNASIDNRNLVWYG